VALPFSGVLASDGGHEFQVRVTYRGRSVVLPVWDVGPWNTRDDYWSPGRRYDDLPVGRPMAHAAVADGYNCGRDEFGRRIRAPNGIDIADGAFWGDLGMSASDWVEVTFLWMGGDSGPAPAPAPPAPAADAIPVEPGAVVVDDGGAGYDAEAAVMWYDAACGLNGRHAWTYGTPDPAQSENRARWAATLPSNGFYEVLAYIPNCGRPATQSARYHISHDGGARDVTINQSAATGSWVSLGIDDVVAGNVAVELGDVTGDDGRAVRFDAVKWLPRSDTAPPDARVTSAAAQAGGTILVRWNGSDDVSGWSDWQRGATVIEGVFVPPGPGGYAFRARAVDWLGHQQPWRDADDMQVEL